MIRMCYTNDSDGNCQLTAWHVIAGRHPVIEGGCMGDSLRRYRLRVAMSKKLWFSDIYWPTPNIISDEPTLLKSKKGQKDQKIIRPCKESADEKMLLIAFCGRPGTVAKPVASEQAKIILNDQTMQQRCPVMHLLVKLYNEDAWARIDCDNTSYIYSWQAEWFKLPHDEVFNRGVDERNKWLKQECEKRRTIGVELQKCAEKHRIHQDAENYRDELGQKRIHELALMLGKYDNNYSFRFDAGPYILAESLNGSKKMAYLYTPTNFERLEVYAAQKKSQFVKKHGSERRVHRTPIAS